MDPLKNAIRTRDTQVIFEAIVQLGGGNLPTDARLVRAALIDVYIERTSEEDGDALMDLIGL